MVVIQRIASRPSLDIDFFRTTAEFLAYRQTNYIDNGKLVLEVNPSDDHFHLTIRLTFNNDADFNTYDNDPLVLTHRAAENAYYEQNGVVSNRTVTRS